MTNLFAEDTISAKSTSEPTTKRNKTKQNQIVISKNQLFQSIDSFSGQRTNSKRFEWKTDCVQRAKWLIKQNDIF